MLTQKKTSKRGPHLRPNRERLADRATLQLKSANVGTQGKLNVGPRPRNPRLSTGGSKKSQRQGAVGIT